MREPGTGQSKFTIDSASQQLRRAQDVKAIPLRKVAGTATPGWRRGHPCAIEHAGTNQLGRVSEQNPAQPTELPSEVWLISDQEMRQETASDKQSGGAVRGSVAKAGHVTCPS